MNRHTVTQKIMIHAPYAMYEKTFYGNDLASKTISDIIQIVGKDAAAFLTEHGVKLSWEHVYIRTSSALIALQDDKKLEEIFAYFSTDDIQFAYFLLSAVHPYPAVAIDSLSIRMKTYTAIPHMFTFIRMEKTPAIC